MTYRSIKHICADKEARMEGLKRRGLLAGPFRNLQADLQFSKQRIYEPMYPSIVHHLAPIHAVPVSLLCVG
jgi:hypothetical protein